MRERKSGLKVHRIDRDYNQKKKKGGGHKSACRDRRVQKSELAEHQAETGHEREWSQSSRFVDYDMSASKREIRETIEIN
ncbi:unnamed protein product [Protopolystoma xenopodis]|uniref:Uncharacterized protein n=1 Tax=Protopolystoma xenopodis TaxID=117903 RepID=A0A448WAC8_9PLAT|nr:unnamed protein product [Protopolystoma xenopodis]